MNITPALPNPYQRPVDQEKTAVAAVRAPNRTRDVVDQPERRELRPQRIDQSERERLAAQAGIVPDWPDSGSVRSNRALASYAEVAQSSERSGLHDLLGFDAYA